MFLTIFNGQKLLLTISTKREMKRNGKRNFPQIICGETSLKLFLSFRISVFYESNRNFFILDSLHT